MRKLLAWAIALTWMAAASPARAQTYFGEPAEMSRFTFNVGLGPSFVLGRAGDVFDTGGAVQLGGGYRFSPRLALQANYFYSAYDVEESRIPEADLEADHTMQYVDLEAVIDAMPGSPVGLYFVAGPALHYRVVSVRRVTGTTLVPFCNPWLYICSTTAVETSTVLGSRDSWDFGVAAGVGLQFRVIPYGGFFLEARWHYVWGPQFTDRSGRERSANTQYVPLMAGFRF